MKQQRWAFTLCTQMFIVLSCYVIDEPLNIAQIELRKRGVVPKETNTMNKTLTQAEQDRAKEAGLLRREKRSTIRVSISASDTVAIIFVRFHFRWLLPASRAAHFNSNSFKVPDDKSLGFIKVSYLFSPRVGEEGAEENSFLTGETVTMKLF